MKKKKKKSLPLRNKIGQHQRAKESSANKTSDSGVSHERGGNSQRRDVQCNYCHRFGHIEKYCRQKLKKNAEASGKSTGNTPKARAYRPPKAGEGM